MSNPPSPTKNSVKPKNSTPPVSPSSPINPMESSIRSEIPETPTTELIPLSQIDLVLSCIYSSPTSPFTKTRTLVCSPTLVISPSNSPLHESRKSVAQTTTQHEEAEHSDNPPGSQPGKVSSAVSERLFDGDLPEEKGVESNILATGEEWAVQSLIEMKEDGLRTLSADEGGKLLKGLGELSQPTFDKTSGTEIVSAPIEQEEDDEPLIFRIKKRRKGREVLTEPVTVEEELVPLEKVVTVSKTKGDSGSESDDVVKVVEKRRKDMLMIKGEDKPKPTKKGRSSKRKRLEVVDDQPLETTKGPGSASNKAKIEKVLSRTERTNVLKTQKVLSGRVFDPDVRDKPGMRDLVDAVELQGWTHLFEWPVPSLFEKEVREFYYNCRFLEDGGLNTKVNGVEFHLSEEILGDILGVPREGISSVDKVVPTTSFVKEISKLPNLSCASISKKFLKGQFQLFFEVVNKVLLPRSEKRTIASSVDLFVMEKLSKFDAINLPAIMIEHIRKTMMVKDGKHGLGYGYLLNRIFAHFEVEVGKGAKGTIKQAFSKYTLVECECVEGRAGNKAKSLVSDLVEKQENLKMELERMTVTLASRDADIVKLKAQMLQMQAGGPGTGEVAEQKSQNASLEAKVKSLTQQLLKAHADENARITLLLQCFAPKPPSSSS